MNKYLAEAKDTIKESKNKEMLLEIVENLANALNEVRNMKNLDLYMMKSDLGFYRKYMDRTSEIIRNTEATAPFATKVLRKGLPILDRNLKSLLKEVQEKAKSACQVSQGTPTQEIACAVNKEVQKWETDNQEEISWYIPNIILVLKSKIPHTLENEGILGLIESMKYEKDLSRVL